MKILILGVNGLIGSTIFKLLFESDDLNVFGTVRDTKFKALFYNDIKKNIIADIDVLNESTMRQLFINHSPDVVINCAGLTKHRPGSGNPLLALPINSLFPHKLAELASKKNNTRIIHISTDCVFSGTKGSYSEEDFTDAREIYGISKSIGELHNLNTVTLRTSTIGHEMGSADGLLEWFLKQQVTCNGYSKAIFSGLPTITLAKIIRDYIIKNTSLHGLYHLSAEPIDKYSLLGLIAEIYSKDIKINIDDSFIIDRSLSSEKFYNETGYNAPSWKILLEEMYNDHLERSSNV
jgi:dTDP-4-dehydrorhamnose reductase